MNRLYLGTYFGIPLYLHWSFLIILAFFVYSPTVQYGVSGLLNYGAFLILIFSTIIFHEYGHSVTAQRLGLRVRDITIMVLGGIANFAYIPRGSKRELVVGVAGPLVNLFIGITTLFLLSVFVDLGSINLIEDDQLVELIITQPEFWYAFGAVNIVIFLFNLLPSFPMDGGRILRSTIAQFTTLERATNITLSIASITAVGMFTIGILSMDILLILVSIFVGIGIIAEKAQLATNNVIDCRFKPGKIESDQEDIQEFIQSCHDQLTEARINLEERGDEIEKITIITNMKSFERDLKRDIIPKYLEGFEDKVEVRESENGESKSNYI